MQRRAIFLMAFAAKFAGGVEALVRVGGVWRG